MALATFTAGKMGSGSYLSGQESCSPLGGSVGPSLRPDQVLSLSVDFPPTFLKEVCFPTHPPPLLGSPCLAGAGCLCVLGKGVVAAPHTVDPSCLWTLKNPIFFLIAAARALSLPSQPTSAWRRLVSPHAPRLLLPAAHPTADAAPLLGHPCRDAPYIMSAAGRGWGNGRPPPWAP